MWIKEMLKALRESGYPNKNTSGMNNDLAVK